LIGVLALGVVVLLRRPALPRDRRVLGMLALLGLTNTALPFVLISWGEQTIDSAVASILNGTVPLFAMVIAHRSMADERITASRLTGLLTGFAGVVILMAGEIGPGGFRQGVGGQVAVLTAALLYAWSAVFARKNLHGLTPIVQAFLPLIVADLFIWTAAVALEAPALVPTTSLTWLALLWLGLLGSCVAYLLYFYLLHSVGPTRATLVTYVFPVVGLVLGVVFLQETLDLSLLLGAALVVAGILAVNGPATVRALRQRSADSAGASVEEGRE
jgi:drug/metabolite transporter (DMT)-like permease